MALAGTAPGLNADQLGAPCASLLLEPSAERSAQGVPGWETEERPAAEHNGYAAMSSYWSGRGVFRASGVVQTVRCTVISMITD